MAKQPSIDRQQAAEAATSRHIKVLQSCVKRHSQQLDVGKQVGKQEGYEILAWQFQVCRASQQPSGRAQPGPQTAAAGPQQALMAAHLHSPTSTAIPG